MENLLISACLLGIPCRYDGRSVKAVDAEALRQKYNLIPVCPEIYGGLPTPRTPSERQGEKTMMKDGTDVTENYKRGAEAAYELCIQLGCKKALLKEKSPSCGNGKIYDGTFSGTLTVGDGVTTEYLKSKGIEVFGESEIEKLI
jgi:uncharacterized protein YbbK (DUF523 family)